MATLVLWLERVFAGFKWLFQLLLTGVSFVVTPVLMLLVLPFVRKDPNNVLPKTLQFLNTMDDTGMNQGMHTINGIPVPGKYEQQVANVQFYATNGMCLVALYVQKVWPKLGIWLSNCNFGWYVKTWYWLGWRNQCYTLFNWLAPTIETVSKTETTNWKILTSGKYWLFLNKNEDVGFGWKLFNAPGKCSFYFRPRFWKKPSN